MAIETSCDDTSVAIVKNGTEILSSVVSSQAEIHSRYGGVVPEVAARNHLENIIPVLDKALRDSFVAKDQIDYIAATRGPGLIGSLLVGVNCAKTLALIMNKPLIAVHHTEGHIYANWLREDTRNINNPPTFPLVCLTVSGGHSNLVYMKSHLDYQIIGDTLDDSAGEAYDKVAKMLGLGYPGGPIISKLALSGNENAYKFPLIDLTPQPARNAQGFLENPILSLDFSFSGLKTAVLQVVRSKKSLTNKDTTDIAASFQKTINQILQRNLDRAIRRYQPKSVLLSGGVGANKHLQNMLVSLIVKNYPDINFYFPKSKYCTDNAAMIAAAAYQHVLIKDFIDLDTLSPDSNFKLI